MTRPAATQVRRYHWFNGDEVVEGLAIMSGHRIRIHMTPDEAIQVANDIADVLEGVK
jgi:carotenoid cleavage dioxygenase-like enzyme